MEGTCRSGVTNKQQPVLSTCPFLNVQVTVRPNIYYVAILSLHCAVVRVRTCEASSFIHSVLRRFRTDNDSVTLYDDVTVY